MVINLKPAEGQSLSELLRQLSILNVCFIVWGCLCRKSSLKKGLTSLSSGHSGFERFNDEQGIVELSQNGSRR